MIVWTDAVGRSNLKYGVKSEQDVIHGLGHKTARILFCPIKITWQNCIYTKKRYNKIYCIYTVYECRDSHADILGFAT